MPYKDKLDRATTGELAGSDDSSMPGSLVDEPRELTKKYTGYPTPRLPSKTRKAAKERPESPNIQMGVTGISHYLYEFSPIFSGTVSDYFFSGNVPDF